MSNEHSQNDVLKSLLQGEEGRQWAAERSQGWSSGSDSNVCTWEGVQCDNSGQVKSLILPRTDLLATIPTELALLTALEAIDLGQNLIRGTIPIEVASMTTLVSVILRDNRQITGSIPVFKSSKLEHLDLSSMGLTGEIPPDFGKHNVDLILLELKENRLRGFLPFGLEELSHLETISISSNQLSGTLPEYIGNMPRLSYLYLDSNFLMGTIPSLPRPLQEVWFQNNLLSGTIPTTIQTSLLHDLFLDGNKLTGTVPQNLCQEDLNSDFFTDIAKNRNLCDSVTCPAGTVGDQGLYPCQTCNSSIWIPYLGRKGDCENWTEARIVNNLLRQSKLSACDYADMVTCNDKGKVTKIHAKNRGLTGSLPDELGLLEYLEELDVSDNQLEGVFPSGLRFAPLTSLRIGGNKLHGILPPLMCENVGRINNAEDGDCTWIACPIGTFSQDTGYGNCSPCASGAQYLASTFCISSAPVETNSEPIWWPLFALMFGILGICGFACILYFYRQKAKTATTTPIISTTGSSSFPHVDEAKTIISQLRDPIRYSFARGQKQRSSSTATTSNNSNGRHVKSNWLQKHLSRTYSYVISLKETEAVNKWPGDKSNKAQNTNVTRGEIDDYGWQERDAILLRRDLESAVRVQTKKLGVWEYPDPLEQPLNYTKSFEHSDDDDDELEKVEFGGDDDDDDDLSEWIRKQQSDPSTRAEWLDVPQIT